MGSQKIFMKKIIAIITLCAFSAMVNARGEGCRLYKVHIKNTGSADCVLKKQYILYGKLTEHSQIPEVVFRGQQAQFEMTNSQIDRFLEAGCLISYECGDDKEVTFFTTTHMQQPTFMKTDKTLSAIVDSKNMEVSFNTSRCNNVYGRSHEVTWELHP